VSAAHGRGESSNALSAFAVLRRRYLSGTLDVFNLGSALQDTRFGSYCRRISDLYLKYAVNGATDTARHLNKTRKWDIENARIMPPSPNEYKEGEIDLANLIPWLQIASVVFSWTVDARGYLQVSDILGYVS
jgi:hypothetical protein